MAYKAHRNNDEQASKDAEKVRAAAEVAEHAGGAVGKAIGKGLKVADGLTGGKASEAIGKNLRNPMGMTPGGMALQGASNAAKKLGSGDPLGLNNEDGLDNANDQGLAGNEGLGGNTGLGGKSSNGAGLSLPKRNPGGSFGLGKNKKDDLSKPNENKDSSEEKPDKKGLFGKKDDDDNSKSEGKMSIKTKSKIIAGIIGASSGLLMMIMIIIVVVSVIFSVGDIVKEFFTNLGNQFIGFFTGDAAVSEQEFYSKLDEVRENVRKHENVCIDVNLILATLTVDKGMDEVIEEGKEPDSEYTTKMERQISLLAAMQIEHPYYSLDTKAAVKCRASEPHEELVTENTKDRYDWDLFYALLGTNDANYLFNDIASDTKREVAQNDKDLNVSFFDRKVDQEMNYSYYLYYPPFAEDGTCSNDYAKEKLKEKNKNEAILDIGDNNTRKDSVYYWNLVDQFIDDYYDDYLPQKGKQEREKAVEKIADDIYNLYASMGPNQSCSNGSNYTYQYIIDGQEYQNVKIQLLYGKDAGDLEDEVIPGELYDLETYVAGVLYGEIAVTDNMDALKAQAVAARTYALKSYNRKEVNGKTATLYIRNSNERQVFCNTREGCHAYSSGVAGTITYVSGEGWKGPLPDNNIYMQAALATEGELLVDANGNLISVSYNSEIQNNWISMAENDLKRYDVILLETYPDAVRIAASRIATGGIIGKIRLVGNFLSRIAAYTFDNLPYNYGGCDEKHDHNCTTGAVKYGPNNCTWYAYVRAIEIIMDSTGSDFSSANTIMNNMCNGGCPNAEDWYARNLKTGVFSSSTDIYAPRLGAIVVLEGIGDAAGHVQVVEDIKYDSEGNVTGIKVSQAGYSSRTLFWTTDHIFSQANYGFDRGYKFIGYIYVLDS